jgi:hypothetical protein
MAEATLGRTICKLAIAGERAGFTVEQMIQLLNDGLDLATLVSMIEWKLNYAEQQTAALSPYDGRADANTNCNDLKSKASGNGRPMPTPNAELLARAIEALERSVRLIDRSRQLAEQQRRITSDVNQPNPAISLYR